MSGVAARSYRPPGPPSGAAALAAATEPPEARGTPADGVRLQVVGDDGIATGTMRDLPEALRAGDLLVANRSAVRKAALDAEVVAGPHAGERRLLHLAQRYGAGVWLVELRPDEATPGPCRLPLGTRLTVHGRILRLWGTYPGLPRLRFAGADDDLASIAEREGRIVRYGHLPRAFGPEAYRTVFGDRPGSAEMASAGRPFTPDLLRRLRQHGVDVATVTLDAGLSGLDAPDDDAGQEAAGRPGPQHLAGPAPHRPQALIGPGGLERAGGSRADRDHATAPVQRGVHGRCRCGVHLERLFGNDQLGIFVGRVQGTEARMERHPCHVDASPP